MVSWFGRGRESALQDLDQQLGGIFDRLDALESAPTSRSTELAIEKHVSIQLEELSQELASVRGFAAGVHGQVGELEKKVDGWSLAISEGIERTERAERRIRAAIARAKKELAEHGLESPGLEAEAEELRKLDGGRSEEHGVLRLSNEVEPPTLTPSSIKGVSLEHIRRFRGF